MSKKPGMRRLSILLPLLLALGLAGCAPKGLQDLSVTSARVVSIVPEGLTSLSAELEVGVHNPSARLTLTDLTGQAKYRGEALLDLSADGVVIEARTDSLYRLPVRCRLSGDSASRNSGESSSRNRSCRSRIRESSIAHSAFFTALSSFW